MYGIVALAVGITVKSGGALHLHDNDLVLKG
jgi:hypothetical protein